MKPINLEVVCAKNSRVGEGIIWCETHGCIWWVDIPEGVVHRLEVGSGKHQSWSTGEPTGCLALGSSEKILVGMQSGIYHLDPSSGKTMLLIDPEPNTPHNRLNDSAMSRDGRWFVGTMPLEAEKEPARGSFYRLDPDLTCTTIATGFHVTNGLSFSPDNDRIYFSDSWSNVQQIWKAEYISDTGEVKNIEPFFDTRQVCGRPDGACVDSEGCYWMAGVGGSELVRLTPKGKIDLRYELPIEKPTKICFGDSDLKTIFISSIDTGAFENELEGCILAFRPGIKGLLEPRFAGNI